MNKRIYWSGQKILKNKISYSVILRDTGTTGEISQDLQRMKTYSITYNTEGLCVIKTLGRCSMVGFGILKEIIDSRIRCGFVKENFDIPDKIMEKFFHHLVIEKLVGDQTE